MKGKVSCVIVARNEEDHIGNTIKSILNQTIDIKIVLVDDGSTDRTPEISKALGVDTLSLPPHRKSYIGNPAIAIRFNIGLDYVRRYSPDFVLIMGGDHELPPDYTESIINKMGKDIGIASGLIQGQPAGTPRGSGRVVNVEFWEKVNRMNYPISLGWESWLVAKASMEGYKVKHFNDVVSFSRKGRKNARKMYRRGRGMYALGYLPIYVISRAWGVMTKFKRPFSGLAMIFGFFFHGRVRKLDTFDFIRARQRKGLIPGIKKRIFRKDR